MSDPFLGPDLIAMLNDNRRGYLAQLVEKLAEITAKNISLGAPREVVLMRYVEDELASPMLYFVMRAFDDYLPSAFEPDATEELPWNSVKAECHELVVIDKLVTVVAYRVEETGETGYAKFYPEMHNALETFTPEELMELLIPEDSTPVEQIEAGRLSLVPITSALVQLVAA